jgi:3-hydroxyacyl-[acyl-carrier-protein] dehydratase
MKFTLVDQMLECGPERAVAVKNVTASEEYLADHFPSFPVLPGVFMLEAMIQAARGVLEQQGLTRMMLGEVRALRYGTFVRPGESLRVEVDLIKSEDGCFTFKGNGSRLCVGTEDPPDTAVSGRFTMRAAAP